MQSKLEILSNSVGTRKTIKQKNKFIRFIEQYASEYQMKFEKHSFNFGKQSGTNISVGDLSKAKVIIMTSYDTDDYIFKKDYRYYIDDEDFNLKIMRANSRNQFLITLIILMFSIMLLSYGSSITGYSQIIVIALGIALGILSMIASRGIPSKKNKKLDSSILMILDLISIYNDDEIAYLLLDQSLYTNLGFAKALEDLKLKDKSIIKLGSMYGSKYVLLESTYQIKDDSILYIDNLVQEKINNKFILQNTDKYVYITYSDKDLKGYYIDDFSKDNNFIDKDYEKIKEIIIKLIGENKSENTSI